MKHVSISAWPYGHTTALVIRDDDTSYFTPSYKIEKIYKQALERGFKVSLGVIPRLKAINDPCVPPKYRGKMSQHAVCDNKELMDYLKVKIAKHQVDIVQHGYTHENLHNVPEFYIRDSSEIKTRLRLGRKILEKCLPIKISVFLAPQNMVSKQAWNVIKQEGLALCRKEKRLYGLMKNTPWSFDNWIPLAKILWAKAFVRGIHPLAKGIIKFPGMIELHHSLEWWTSKNYPKLVRKAKQKFTETMMMSGLFCILNHYWLYYEDWQDDVSDQEMLRCFYVLLDFFDTQDIWKATLTDVVNWIKKMNEIEVKVKRGKATVKSSTPLQGVTIKGENCTLTPANEDDVEVKEKEETMFLIYKRLEAGEKKIFFID